MKKLFAMLCVLGLLTAGCGIQTQEGETLPAETPAAPAAEAPTEPVTEPAPPPALAFRVLADRTPVILGQLRRGDRLEILGQDREGYWSTETALGRGLVETRLARPDSAAPFVPWEGFARYGMTLHDSFYLSGEGQPVPLNTGVRVLDDLGYVLLVQIGEDQGYVKADQVSQWRTRTGGGGGGSGGQDGGDIQMARPGFAFRLSDLEAEPVTGPARVLAEGTPVVLGFCSRGERLQILEQPLPDQMLEGCHTVVLEDGSLAYVPRNLAVPEDQPEYAAWDGFAARQAQAYDNFHLAGEPVKPVALNTQLRVLEDLEDCWLVEIGEEMFFMAKDQVSETRTHVGSGGSGGGSDDGAWTPPVM